MTSSGTGTRSTSDSGDVTSVDAAPGEPAEVSDAESRSRSERVAARLVGLLRRYDLVGLLVGLLFVALSMTPSLLPRASMVQGIVTGISAAAGYGVGVGVRAVWRYLELPEPRGSTARWLTWTLVAVLAVVAAYSMFNLVRWQNDLRRLFDMDVIDDWTYPVVMLLVGAVVAVAVIALARAVRRLVGAVSRWFGRVVPRRVGRVAGAAVAVLLLWALISGVLLESAVGVANRAFSVQNGRVDESLPVPSTSYRSGGPASEIAWETLGSPGRSWIANGPTAEDIDAFSGGGAMEPIRAYVGIDSAGSVEERAELLRDELIALGAFDREVLVLATSTGSGGIDPRGTSTVEYVHNGDTAIAGVQYSFLPSALSFFVDQRAALEASTTTFEVIHDYWRDLDPADRPELYLFGVSLGSYGSEASATSIRASGDPIDGAVWAGPTFNNDEWVRVTDDRDDGSPAWLPVYDGGSVIRFTDDGDDLDAPSGEWEDNRYVYIEHGSDPVSFFSPGLLFSEPAWLRGDRSPDISKHMQWYPIVTFWQVLFDLPMGGSVPRGHGHNFGVPAYVAAWVAVTQPDGWTDADSVRLTDHLVALDDG